MFIDYNPNPVGRRVGDCSVRAISKALGVDWETAYAMIASNGFAMGDMPSSNSVWGAVLRQNGFKKQAIPNSCPDCYTIRSFAKDNPRGTFVVGTGSHAVAVINGSYYDAFDSGHETPIYYFRKES